MTIRHLKIFITVVKCGAMRRAAEALFISQPSVSQAIQDLENYYGIKLFDRISQKLYLTDVGRTLLPYAQKAVDIFESIDMVVRSSSNNPKITIGASVSVGTYILNDLIDNFQVKVPTSDIDVIINNTTAIETMVFENKLDIAMVEGRITSESLVKIPLWKDELVIIAGKKHPLYREESIKLSDLNNENLIAREEGSTERNQYDLLLMENHITMKKKWCASNTEAIKNAVAYGRGLGIISKLLIKKELLDGTLRILPIENIKVTRDIQLIYHNDKYISPVLQKFIDTCIELV